MKKLIAITIVAFTFFSCATTNQSVQSVPMKIVTAIDPIKADYTINMKNKIEGSSKSVWLLGFFRIYGNSTYADGMSYTANFGTGQEGFARLFGISAISKVAQTKAAAAYRAIESSNADFIANPHYTIKQTKLLFGIIKNYNATVSGYSGKYTKLYQGKQTENN